MYVPKTIFCISIPLTSTSTFNLLTSKLLCQLLLTWVTYVLNLNVVRFSFFRVTREHTTDKTAGLGVLDWTVMHNVASGGLDGCIETENKTIRLDMSKISHLCGIYI